MIFDNESNRDLNTAIFLISSLSPKAKNNIELELYRQDADSDGATERVILDSVFGDLLSDLQDIGINIGIDYHEVIEDIGPLFNFLHFVSYLLPNSLYDMLKARQDIRQCVEHLLNGTLGHHETLIETYLSELGGLDGQPALAPEITNEIDVLYPVIKQTETFTDYMRQLLDLVQQESLVVNVSEDSHKTYRDTIRDIVSKMSDVVNHFSEKPFYETLCVLQNWIIKDLTRPDAFINYAYLFTTDVATLPEDLIPAFNKRWYHYKVSNNWCADYYSIRTVTPDIPAQVMFYIFGYGVSKTKTEYLAFTQSARAVYRVPLVDDYILSLYTGA